MSGAASIAAAKNRRTKADPNQKPVISCSSKSGSCPLPGGNKVVSTPRLIDEESLQIKGPMHVMQVLHVHEQRLNKIDDKIKQQMQFAISPQAVFTAPQECIQEEGQACDAECYDRISALEEKVQMLEEVIMNLQLTLTNVQSFAMETSLAMLKLQNQVSATPVPATPVPATPVPTTPVSLVVIEQSPPAESTED
jgi:hypothetical protein